MRYVFGVDILGTHIKFGFFQEDGKLLDKWQVTLPRQGDSNLIVPTIAEEVEGCLSRKGIFEDDVIGIGVGIPGPVSAGGVVNKCVNLNWGVFNIDRALSGLTGLRVKTSNVANLSALGEYQSGAGSKNMVYVAMNTGFGGGIICNGVLVNGVHGGAGEIGHIPVNPAETAVCGCGKKGCLEQYSSATGIVRCMKLLLEESDEPCVLRGKEFVAKDVFDAARDGDKLAVRELEQMAAYLGMALASIAATTDPEMFLLGGGVSRAGDVLTDAVTAAYKKFVFHPSREAPIKVASLGNDAGIYGAVRLVLGADA